MPVKHFLLWFPMIAIAFANAMLREMIFIKHFSELRAHQYSTITLTIFCAVYIWFVIPVLNFQAARQALITGFVWVVLTICFEFVLGRATKKTWEVLLENYNLADGRLWILFLVSLFILPVIFYTIRDR